MASRAAGSREPAFCLSFAKRMAVTKNLPENARGCVSQLAVTPYRSAAQLAGPG